MKKPFLLIIFLIIIIITLSIVRVAFLNGVSTAGIKLADIELEIEKYRKENTLMEEKILGSSALTNLEVKARKLGFVEPKSQVYLSNPLPLALGNTR